MAIKQNESDTLEAPFELGEIQAGNPLPIGGAHEYGDGVNFVLFSRHATGVHMELYQNAGDSSQADMLFLTQVEAKRRVIVLTEQDMCDLCEKEFAAGRVPREIEFICAITPDELRARLEEARAKASRESSGKAAGV